MKTTENLEQLLARFTKRTTQLEEEQAKLEEQKTAMRAMQNINAINNSKGGDTYNQTSVHSNGEPTSDHSDSTAKHLAEARYG